MYKKRKTFLFDPFPAHGHVNAMLRLANKLVESGNKIIFIGYSDFAEKVKSSGHDFYVIDSFILTSEIKDVMDNGWLGSFFMNLVSSRNNRLGLDRY